MIPSVAQSELQIFFEEGWQGTYSLGLDLRTVEVGDPKNGTDAAGAFRITMFSRFREGGPLESTMHWDVDTRTGHAGKILVAPPTRFGLAFSLQQLRGDNCNVSWFVMREASA